MSGTAAIHQGKIRDQSRTCASPFPNNRRRYGNEQSIEGGTNHDGRLEKKRSARKPPESTWRVAIQRISTANGETKANLNSSRVDSDWTTKRARSRAKGRLSLVLKSGQRKCSGGQKIRLGKTDADRTDGRILIATDAFREISLEERSRHRYETWDLQAAKGSKRESAKGQTCGSIVSCRVRLGKKCSELASGLREGSVDVEAAEAAKIRRFGDGNEGRRPAMFACRAALCQRIDELRSGK
ncbi:hypothetical protein C8R47DRAFT_1277066 [Mycena vitilis]|nr:hypothetical protein C8R47DRAFT_1277066 [Mycena vitilis]